MQGIDLDSKIHNKLVDIKNDLQSVSDRLDELEKENHNLLNDIDNELEKLSYDCACTGITWGYVEDKLEEIRRKLF